MRDDSPLRVFFTGLEMKKFKDLVQDEDNRQQDVG
jgi:hypothetical protein